MSRTGARAGEGARFLAQRLLLKPVVRAAVSVQVVGLERLAALEPPFVVVANHSSHLDAPLLVGFLPWRLVRVLAVGAAADYFFHRRWRAVLTALFFNGFPVHRERASGAPAVPRARGLAADLLDAGTPLLLFPEGTRSRDGAMAAFKPGAAALCVSRGVPVVPVGLQGAFAAMPQGRPLPRPGRPRVRVVVGEPLRPRPEESARELTARAAASVAALSAQRAPRAGGGGEEHPGQSRAS